MRGPIAERLQKYLARTGAASRRKCEELIAAGRVMVNGEIVTEMGTTVGPGDVVLLDGEPVEPEPLEYYLLNKPAGVVCTVSDPEGRRTVVDFIPSRARIFPVGRLDKDTTGLIILTNDGKFAHRLMHPRYEVDKVYRAEVRGKIDEARLERLRRGIRLEDALTAPAGVCLLAAREDASELELTIHEGRKRQVRRMLEAVGRPVIRLHRCRYAMLDDRRLGIGRFRLLVPQELRELRKLSGEDSTDE